MNETIASYHPHYANYQWIKKAKDEKYPLYSLVLVKEKFERYQKEVEPRDCSVNDVMLVLVSFLYTRKELNIDITSDNIYFFYAVGEGSVRFRKKQKGDPPRSALKVKENNMKVTFQKKSRNPVDYTFYANQNVFFQGSLQDQSTSSSFSSAPTDIIIFEYSLRSCCLIFPERSIKEVIFQKSPDEYDSFIGFEHVYIQGISPEVLDQMIQKLWPDQWNGPLPSSLWAVEYKTFTDYAFFSFLRDIILIDLEQDMHRWKMYKHATLTEQIGLFLFLLLLGYLFWAHCMLRLAFFLRSASLLHLGKDFLHHEPGDEDIDVYYILFCIVLYIIKMRIAETKPPRVDFAYGNYSFARVVCCLPLLFLDYLVSFVIVQEILYLNRIFEEKNRLYMRNKRYMFEDHIESDREVAHVFLLFLISALLFSPGTIAFITLATYSIGRFKGKDCRYSSQVIQLFMDGFSHRFVWLAIAYSMHDTFDRRVWYFAGVLYGLLGLLFPQLDLFYARERKKIKQANDPNFPIFFFLKHI